MKTLTQQNKVLKKYFKIELDISTAPNCPQDRELALIPSWKKIAPTYTDAVKEVFDSLKKERNFYNHIEGKIGSDRLRQTERKLRVTMPEILCVQLGQKHKGQSVEYVRKNYESNEVGLGAYEVGMILLLNSDVLTKYKDFWIDCAGDEYAPGADGDFSDAPIFKFSDGKVKFDDDWTARAYDKCGSASAFLPQSILDSCTLESFDSSTLESRVKNLEEDMEKVRSVLSILN